MVTINLTETQRDELAALLASTISDLGMEIAETDRLDYRNGLKDRRQHLRRVLDQLQDESPASKPA